jgi:histidinol-phosphatase
VSELGGRMEFASDVARAAGAVALRHFGKGIAVERKADRTPVTAADREAEDLIRGRIEAAYPRDGILGEERGEKPGTSGRRWIIDPIDGTKSFIQGVPLFGVIIGLEGPEGAEGGAVYMPALDELVCAARGEGTWWNGRRARVSAVSDLAEACVVYTSLRNFDAGPPGARAAWARISSATRIQRGWGDCYGHVLVATGRAEVMLDPLLNPWDCAPFPVILEEAGGSFTDWGGNRTFRGGSGISTNGRLYERIRALLKVPDGGPDGAAAGAEGEMP